MRRVLILVGVAAVVAVGVIAYGLTRTSALDPKVAAAYVRAQAHALCVVQSHSYRTHAALEAAYRHAQASGPLSQIDLSRARDAAEKDATLRRRISARVARLCG